VEDIYTKRLLPLKGGGTTPLDVYIPREEGDYLYSLVRQRRPALTVEVGLANGLSALFIAAALRDNGAGTHIAIDPFQHTDWRDIGIGLLRQAGLADLVRLIEKPSHQALPQLEQEGIHAGLVFIDGAHLFDYAMADFLGADRILEVGGLIAFDDSDWPAVRPVVRYVLSNRHYRVAYPGLVIEPPPGRPTLPGRLLRGLGRRVPWLGARLREDFLHPDRDLGTEGRCVVLENLAEDDRNSQDRSAHRPF
jgi:predicted O-methyltransferase YrrM